MQDLVSLMQQGLEILKGVVMSNVEEEQEEEQRQTVSCKPAGLSDGRLTGILYDFIRLDEEQKERKRLFSVCTEVCFFLSCLVTVSVECLVSVRYKEVSLA